MKDQITTEQAENIEAAQIVEAIDDYVWYGEGGISTGTRAKSGLVIGALVKVLVAKGVLSLQDVKRVLTND